MNLEQSGRTPDGQKFVPISYCVNETLLELEDYSGKQVERYTGLAIKIYRDLNLTVLHTALKVAYLTMDSLNTVTLPIDYQQYMKIGIPVNGRLWNLGLDESLLLPDGVSCGDDARELFVDNGGISGPDFGYYYTDHYRDGQYVGGLYGIGGGYRQAYYRIDEEQNKIIFDGPVQQSQIVLEYKTTGIGPQTLVPRQAISAIVAGIHWRRNIRKAASVWSPLMNAYLSEERRLQAYENQFDPQKYLDMMYETTYQTAKR